MGKGSSEVPVFLKAHYSLKGSWDDFLAFDGVTPFSKCHGKPVLSKTRHPCCISEQPHVFFFWNAPSVKYFPINFQRKVP